MKLYFILLIAINAPQSFRSLKKVSFHSPSVPFPSLNPVTVFDFPLSVFYVFPLWFSCVMNLCSPFYLFQQQKSNTSPYLLANSPPLRPSFLALPPLTLFIQRLESPIRFWSKCTPLGRSPCFLLLLLPPSFSTPPNVLCTDSRSAFFFFSLRRERTKSDTRWSSLCHFSIPVKLLYLTKHVFPPYD